MSTAARLSKPEWWTILVFYILACAWSWPFFWWQVTNSASWDAWSLPAEVKECFIQWGPGLAAIAVYYLFPRTRPRFLSLAGSSWKRSLICFLSPIVVLWIVFILRGQPHWIRVPYDLTLAGLACMGEEVGWRGFLQGALRPIDAIRRSLLIAILWTLWHFNPTSEGVMSHLEVLLPVTIVVSLVLIWLTERTGSLLLAAAVHEWLDIGAGYDDYRRWVALATVPLWVWIAWTWPQRKRNHAATSASNLSVSPIVS